MTTGLDTRSDLLEAKAAVDWPVSHFPSLRERLAHWLKASVSVEFKDPDPNVPNFVMVAVEKEPLPLAFNLEVGAYINAIRTSLDILATALAYRHSLPRSDKTYFPIVGNLQIFRGGRYKGHEFVDGLPQREGDLIKSLKPYKGGNDLLWTLHELDVVRKHRRLLTVEAHPQAMSITGIGVERDFHPVAGQGWIRADNEIVLGLFRKGAPKPKIDYTPLIGFGEAVATQHADVLTLLCDFARLAKAIINLFDTKALS